MYMQLFGEGIVLGVTTAIPLKYGVSLDPVDYEILLLRTVSNTTSLFPKNLNSSFNVDRYIDYFIIILIIFTAIVFILTIVDVYRKVQDDPSTKLPVFGIGFLFGVMLIFMA